MGSYKFLHEQTILGGLAPEQRTEGAVQFQAGGSLGQDPDLTYDSVLNELTVEDVLTTTMTASGLVTANGGVTLGAAQAMTIPGGFQKLSVGTTQVSVVATITVAATDTAILCAGTASPAPSPTAQLVNLPAMATAVGQTVTILDLYGGANSNNITIDASGTEKINGATQLVLSTAYKSVTLLCTGQASHEWIVINAS